MDEPVFEIQQRKYSTASRVITMRITKQMLAAVDEAAKASNRTRNEILSMALEFSLAHTVVSAERPENADGGVLYITEKNRKASPKDET